MKTEPKHTPGPWYYEGGESRSIFHPIEIGSRIATVDSTFDGRGWNLKSNNKWQANARLISAAPELYDALSDAIKFIKLSVPYGSQPRGLDKWDALITALNK